MTGFIPDEDYFFESLFLFLICRFCGGFGRFAVFDGGLSEFGDRVFVRGPPGGPVVILTVSIADSQIAQPVVPAAVMIAAAARIMIFFIPFFPFLVSWNF